MAPQKSSLVSRVTAALPELKKRADEAEAGRRLPDATMDILKEIGMVRALVPSMYGGAEEDVFDWLQAVRLISSVDMSTGWVAGLGGAHGFAISQFDQRLQEDVWGKAGPDVFISTSGAAEGKSERVEGGARLSGRWRFSSGCDHAEWAIVGTQLLNPASGESEFYLAVAPRSDFQIDDTWYTSGLRGSGSKDLVFEDAFVPEHRLAGPTYNFPSPSSGVHANPLYRIPFMAIFPIIFAPIVLGGAEGALSLYQESLQRRVRPHTGQRAIESPLSQARVAETLLETRASAAMLEKHWLTLARHAQGGPLLPFEQILEWRAENAFAGRLAMRAIDRIMEGAGGSAQYTKQLLQRFWRDAHTAGGHVYFDCDSALQVLGRHVLGLPPDPKLM